MAVKLGAHYEYAFRMNNNPGGEKAFLELSETIINLARDIGDYNGGWFRVEFIDHLTSETLNIYQGPDIIFQAGQDLYGDWTILLNDIPSHFEVAMALRKLVY